MTDLERVQRERDFAEKYRPQFAEMAGMSGDPHWGDIATVLGAKVRKQDAELTALRERVQAEMCAKIDAYVQLRYLWETTRSCPCGARMESLNTHPHVIGCPTGRAIELSPTPGA